MKPAAFDYERPDTVEEVVDLLARHGDDARLIAGGQSLVPMMAFRLSRPAVLIDLADVTELDGLDNDADHFTVGAMVRQRRVLTDADVALHMPALADATRFVGHYQTRNRGTIGGSLALADPAAENPALALALGARMRLASAAGERCVEARDFFQGAYMTDVAADELLTAIDYPHWGEGSAVVVDEIARRPGDFALTGLVAAVRRNGDGRIDRAGVAWFGMSSDPGQVPGAEAMLLGERADEIDLAAVARQAVTDVEPKDDVQATADYRRAAGVDLAMRVIGRALEKAKA